MKLLGLAACPGLLPRYVPTGAAYFLEEKFHPLSFCIGVAGVASIGPANYLLVITWENSSPNAEKAKSLGLPAQQPPKGPGKCCSDPKLAANNNSGSPQVIKRNMFLPPPIIRTGGGVSYQVGSGLSLPGTKTTLPPQKGLDRIIKVGFGPTGQAAGPADRYRSTRSQSLAGRVACSLANTRSSPRREINAASLQRSWVVSVVMGHRQNKAVFISGRRPVFFPVTRLPLSF